MVAARNRRVRVLQIGTQGSEHFDISRLDSRRAVQQFCLIKFGPHNTAKARSSRNAYRGSEREQVRRFSRQLNQLLRELGE